MKNHEADLAIGFLTKLISKPYGRATVIPPAWELKLGHLILDSDFLQSRSHQVFAILHILTIYFIEEKLIFYRFP